MNHTHLSAKSKNAGNPVRAGLKRNKPSPLTLEPRLMFAADVTVPEGHEFVAVVRPIVTVDSYAISGGADASKFEINALGQLGFKTKPDFETPSDSGANNVYNVEVTKDPIGPEKWTGANTTTKYTITVTDVDEGPVALDDSKSVSEDMKSFTIDVLSNDTRDPDLGAVTTITEARVTNVTDIVGLKPSDVTVSIVDNQIQVKLNENFDRLRWHPAFIDIDYTITGTGGKFGSVGMPDSATLHVKVTGADDPLEIKTGASGSLNESDAGPSKAISEDLVLVDRDEVDTLLHEAENWLSGRRGDALDKYDLAADQYGAHTHELGTLTINKGETHDSWTYTMTTAHEELGATEKLVDSFVIKTANGELLTISITINGQNDTPTANDIFVNVGEDGPATTLNSGAHDNDANDKLTYTLDTSKTIGKVTNNNDGTFSYSPNGKFESLPAGVNASDSFEYTVTDISGASVTRTATVTINGVNDPASIREVTYPRYPDTNVTEAGVGTFGDPSAKGQLKVSDIDTGENVFAAPSETALSGMYGNFTFNVKTGNWTYQLDNSLPATQALWANHYIAQHAFDTLTVSSADGSASKTIVVNVWGTNDAAAIRGDLNQTIDENDTGYQGVMPFWGYYAGGNVITGKIDVSDIDSPDRMQPQFLTPTKYGEFSMDTQGNWIYTMNEAHDWLNDGDTLYDRINVQSFDGTKSFVTIRIDGSNDAPKIDLMHKFVLGTEDTPIPVGGIRVSDVDNVFLTTTVSVEHGYLTVGKSSGPETPHPTEMASFSKGAADLKYFSVEGSGTGSITLHGMAWQINAALSSLTYRPTADYNGPAMLTVTTSDQTGPVKPSMGDGDYKSYARVSGDDHPVFEGDGKSTVKHIYIFVKPVADIADDTASTRQNTAVSIDVNANDSFENEHHHIARINGERFGKDGLVVVDNGVVTLNEDGTLSFTPNAGFYGDASFTYTVRSGGVTETASVTVTVIADAATRSRTGGESGAGGITGTYVAGAGNILGVSGFRGDLSGTRVPGQSDAPSGDAGGGFNPNALLNNAPTAAGFGEGDLSEFLPFELAMMDLSGKDDFAVFLPAGEKASFALPADMLQGPQAVDFAVFQANGEPLPDWLVFDPITGKFLGKAPEGMHGTVRIQLTGRDAKGIERVIRISVNVDVQERGALAERMTPDRDARLVVAESTIAVRGNGRPGLSDQLQSARRGLSSERLARVVSAATMAKL